MNLLPLALLLFTASTSEATSNDETSLHVRVDSDRSDELAVRFERSGHDVVEGSVTDAALELVVTRAELDELRERGLEVTVLSVGRPFRDVQDESGDVPGYPDLDAVYAAMAQAEANFPAICQVVDLTARYGTPTTFEGRHLLAVKISDNVAVDEDEPATLIVSTHHARETVTPVIALEAITQLTTQYASNATIQAAVDANEIWIAPVWNPDGYVHVFDVNNLWRKNRTVFGNGIGVDLNRNYPFGWASACGGSSSVSSETYRGPSKNSEAETVTMMAWSFERVFAKVLDFHSFGRETLWEYACKTHPLASWLQSQAVAISNLAGYAGGERAPSAEGEHFEWQLRRFGNYPFLMETHTSFQPAFASAQAEAAQIWPAILAVIGRAIPVSGNITDACTGEPLVATITPTGLSFSNAETNESNARFGRYHAFLPNGPETLRFEAPGYVTQDIPVNVTADGQVLDVSLSRVPVPSGLSGDVTQISIAAGGTQTLELNSGPALGGLEYLLLGSAHGTSPGTRWGEHTIPLNLDHYLQATFNHRSELLTGSFGRLDGCGRATARVTVAPGQAPFLAGTTLHHAYVVFDPRTPPLAPKVRSITLAEVSDPVSLDLIP